MVKELYCMKVVGIKPVLLLTLRVPQWSAEGAVQTLYSLMQRLRGVIHDGCKFGQYPPLTHILHRIQRTAVDRAGPLDQLVQSLPVPLLQSPRKS